MEYGVIEIDAFACIHVGIVFEVFSHVSLKDIGVFVSLIKY